MVNIEVPSLRQTLLQCLSQYGTSMLDSCSVTGSKLALFPSETQSHKTFVARSRPPLPTSRLPSLFPRKVRYNHPPALAPRAEPAGLEPKWLLSLKNNGNRHCKEQHIRPMRGPRTPAPLLKFYNSARQGAARVAGAAGGAPTPIIEF